MPLKNIPAKSNGIFHFWDYPIAPCGEERVGYVSNVVFCNGWTVNEYNEVFIYYASAASVEQRVNLIKSNLDILHQFQ